MVNYIKFLTIFCLSLMSSGTYAQISSIDGDRTESGDKKMAEFRKQLDENIRASRAPYDSLTNLKYLSKLVGQKLFCARPIKFGILMEYSDTVYKQRIVREPRSLVGHYLTLLNYDSKYDYGLTENLHLKDDNTQKEYAIRFYDEKNSGCYLVSVPYFEKMKSLFMGKEYVYVKCDYIKTDFRSKITNDKLYDLNEKKERDDIEDGSIWKIVDVSVLTTKSDFAIVDNDTPCPVIIVCENEKYGKCYQYISKDGNSINIYHDNGTSDGIKKDLLFTCFVSKEQYMPIKNHRDSILQAEKREIQLKRKNLIKKYGVANVKLMDEGYVKVGWTKQMCIESWGEPEEINTSRNKYGTYEQWVYYGNRYLYFTNGKLTSIQE